jgi:hypothetical protein
MSTREAAPRRRSAESCDLSSCLAPQSLNPSRKTRQIGYLEYQAIAGSAGGSHALCSLSSAPGTLRLRLGHLEDEALSALFAASDAYWTPTRHEGLCLTLLEAMAAGAPVVAADVPAVNEIVEDGLNGLLFPAGRPEALAETTVRLLADPDLRPRLSVLLLTTPISSTSVASSLPSWDEGGRVTPIPRISTSTRPAGWRENSSRPASPLACAPD